VSGAFHPAELRPASEPAPLLKPSP
jgi:hypothetical protein